MDIQHKNPSARVIFSILQRPHKISLFSPHMPYALQAELFTLDIYAGTIVLDVACAGPEIEQYIACEAISFDIETIKELTFIDREVYSLSHLAFKIVSKNTTFYRLECQLPPSLLIKENRSSIRIPLILGIKTRVCLGAYSSDFTITAKLSNLSTGGCLIDIALSDSLHLEIGQHVPSLTLEFPNGECFISEAKVCHMRPLGNNGYAAVGLQFINLLPSQNEAIFHAVNELEREVIFRTGASDKAHSPSSLFVAGMKEKSKVLKENLEGEKISRQTPMERAVLEIAHKIQVGLMHMKTQHAFPAAIFYDCADTLRYLVMKDRKAFLYALSLLRNEPDWVRHSIQVAGRLCDMLLLWDPHDPDLREVILGALLHNLGKLLLVSKEIPSLKINMNPSQKSRLKSHVVVLNNKFTELGWKPTAACRDIIDNINERLDGSGYPAGKRCAQLSSKARLASVIKVINTLTHARNGDLPLLPIDAYKKINKLSSAYDKIFLCSYIQLYGLYPTGCLAKFSGGFLAWIMDTGNKGQPEQVNIVKNLRFPDENLNIIISKSDLSQIGYIENIINPADYGL